MCFLPAFNYTEARAVFPIGYIARCIGGYLVFPTIADYVAWRLQVTK